MYLLITTLLKKHKILLYSLSLTTFLGLILRLYHINFGLPHSFHADEPEFAELAIKYTYNLKSIMRTKSYYELIPVSYVYGTVPTYILTVVTMVFSKSANLLGIGFDKTILYVAMRVFQAIFTMLIPIATTGIYFLLFSHERSSTSQKKLGLLFAFFFAALNWKLIVLAHYINADIFLTVFLSLSYLFLIYYYFQGPNKKITIVLGVLLGMAFGTKVTAILSLPLYLLLYISKKDFYGLAVLLFIIFGTFVITNPFSWAFANDFAFRTITLSVKENGLVFDSVDFGYFKYIYSLNYLVTPALFVGLLLGVVLIFKKGSDTTLHFATVGIVAAYLLFYSLSTRRVDRWLLPILPLVFVYASYGIISLQKYLNKYVYYVALVAVVVIYLYFPYLLIWQFNRHTPKSEAYVWAQNNLPKLSTKLVLSKEGLDPMNKLDSVKVMNFESYESEGAQYSLPENPLVYDYVIISSRPLKYAKNEEIAKKYPFYHQAWVNFENTINNPSQFILIKEFSLPKPDLIELSDVLIYERITQDSL